MKLEPNFFQQKKKNKTNEQKKTNEKKKNESFPSEKN